MSDSQKNIAIDRTVFPGRLRQLREERHLSQSDLAQKAGINYRTVHDLELGKRGRCQQKTLLMLALALDLSLEDLLAPPTSAVDPAITEARRRRADRLRLSFIVIVFAVVAVTAGVLWHEGHAHADWTLGDDGVLSARDGIFGISLWAWPPESCLTSCRVSPWDPEYLLVGTGRDAPDSGQLLCVARATGKTVWAVGPDVAAMTRVWGEETVRKSGFSCRLVGPADLEGDGVAEFVVIFSHGLYYPTAVCTISREGRLLSQYTNRGHIFDQRIDDLDGDGKDEIIAAGTNNAVGHQGATVFILDDLHRRGAAVDSLSSPWSSEPDSALVRLVLPQFPAPYMDVLKASRLGAFNLQVYRNPDNLTMLSVEVGSNDEQDRILVHLDADLHPVGAEPKDAFREKTISQWPDSLKVGTGPGDPVWLARWLSGYRRFEAGHWPPPRVAAGT